MKLTSVNIAQKTTFEHAGKTEVTGIFKQPVPGPVWISRLGLEGDFIASARHHGGPDQAVYIYGTGDYGWWSHQLGQELPPGTFGENLTVSDLESASFSIGDRLIVGSVALEVTSPRIPCKTFARRMDDPDFMERFHQAGRPGLYCRVLTEGPVQAGDTITVDVYPGERVMAVELFRAYYETGLEAASIRRFLASPLALRARTMWTERLRELQPGGTDQ